jgi:predicted branched-subunit amino acid permease
MDGTFPGPSRRRGDRGKASSSKCELVATDLVHEDTQRARSATGAAGATGADRGGWGAGVAAMLPLVVGYAPFALAVGAVVAAHGDVVAGWTGSWVVYGGSAQIATLHTLETSGLLLAILAGALVHGRLVVYSASLARDWQGQPRWFRLVAAPLVIDPTWAVVDARDGRHWSLAEQRGFFLGAALTLGVVWSALMAVGVVAGDRIDVRHLAVAVPLCLASMVGPRIRDVDTRVVCGAAAVATMLAGGLPAGARVPVAVVVGCLAGAFTDRGAR